jgi:GNAT superfamily N-acetyltransferase
MKIVNFDRNRKDHLAYATKHYFTGFLPQIPALPDGPIPNPIPWAYIAEEEGVVIGSVIIEYEPDPAYWPRLNLPLLQMPHLYAVHVDAEHRNKGTGKALVAKAIQYCRRLGFTHVALDTHSAAQWYIKNWNFKFSHTAPPYEGQVSDVYVKDLNARGFAAISPERQREIASQGGKKAHADGTAHRYTKEEAAIAGKLGAKKRYGK